MTLNHKNVVRITCNVVWIETTPCLNLIMSEKRQLLHTIPLCAAHQPSHPQNVNEFKGAKSCNLSNPSKASKTWTVVSPDYNFTMIYVIFLQILHCFNEKIPPRYTYWHIKVKISKRFIFSYFSKQTNSK